jgi:MoaA/NifB/PqqE/SkfB family radical SAM enzyme/SAM-dependent methyltransferase
MRGDTFFSEVSKRPPFTKLHPRMASYLKEYLSGEKVAEFDGRFVLNTHFPPYPSPAFENLVRQFNLVGDAAERRLYSVTLGATNRCSFNCWHCYNAGRSEKDVPLKALEDLAKRLQALGTVMVTLTGGEPLLREDLEEIAGAFDETTSLILGTTGDGLTAERARRLRERGVFAVGISLDTTDEKEHDRMRGREGAFRVALDGLETAGENGLYPYAVTVASHELLDPERFFPFLEFARDAGAREVHLLEPSATGRLAGQTEMLLTGEERRTILEYQKQVAADEDLPVLSTFLYLESAEAFGCGAGLTHLYIDGSGEVCPCNLVPLSFGNVLDEPLDRILDRLGQHFQRPRTACVGRMLAKHVPPHQLPASPSLSAAICGAHLPREHPLPRFFRVRSESREEVGRKELEQAYDRVRDDYDGFWLAEAGKPIDELVHRVPWHGREMVFEAGCGTGYATELLAKRGRVVVASDVSTGMLEVARRRLRGSGCLNVRFESRDALEALQEEKPFDVVFSSWVLGYIPLKPFFNAAHLSLRRGGRLAFVVHLENSPREPLEIFAEIVAREPSVLEKRVSFDFPRNSDHVRDEMIEAGFEVEDLREGAVVFRYGSAEAVLEHLLKSGAGTAFYDAVDERRRDELAGEFVRMLSDRHEEAEDFDVVHEYVACVARKREKDSETRPHDN